MGSSIDFTGSNFAWKQYSISFKNNGTSLAIQLHASGTLVNEIITGSSVNAITGAMVAQIGSLITNAPSSSADRRMGKTFWFS